MALTNTKTTARRSLGELFACLFKIPEAAHRKPAVCGSACRVRTDCVADWRVCHAAQHFFQLLPPLICMPFYAGVTQVTRELVRGKKIKPPLRPL